MENKSPQQQLLDKFGVLHQADIWVEELSELIQAIQKAKRYKVLTEDGISYLNEDLTQSETKAIKNLYEEFADVQNSLKQIELLMEHKFILYAKDQTTLKIINTLNQ